MSGKKLDNKTLDYKQHYDYIILGAGSGGLTVAVGLAGLKKKVLLVSKELGGDCTNFGCVPSKSLLHHARNFKEGKLEKSQVLSHVQKEIKVTLLHDKSLINSDYVTYVEGTAEFDSSTSIKVHISNTGEIKNFKFKRAIVSTGSSPRRMEIEGLPESKIITNEEIFYLEDIPESLTIIGGGPIGVEMATAFSMLGTKVYLLSNTRILIRDPKELTQIVKKSLQEQDPKVEIVENSFKQVFENGKLISYDDNGNSNGSFPETDYYFLSVGRVPNTKLELEKAKIKYSHKGIFVDKYLRTSNKKVYAIGDCTTYPKFTHLANNQGRFIVKRVATKVVKYKQTALPYVTYSNPPIATTGEIQESDLVKRYKLEFSETDRGKIDSLEKSLGYVFVNMLTGRIVGASIAGDFAEHVINFFTLAVNKKVSMFKMDSFMVPYPTYMDAFNSVYSRFLVDFMSGLKSNILIVLKRNANRIFAFTFWFLTATFSLYYLRSINYDLLEFISSIFSVLNSPTGFLLFVLLYVLRGIIFFPAILLTTVAGTAFGLVNGVLATMVASNISSTVNYYLGKTIFSNQKNNERAMEIVNDPHKNDFLKILFLRFAAFPYDPLSYISGAINIKYTHFILATIIGSIPGTVAFVTFGTGVKDIQELQNAKIEPQFFVLGIVLFVVSILVSLIVNKLQTSKVSKG